jgi:oxygen-independent coproporphyrinogen-3 oxidase
MNVGVQPTGERALPSVDARFDAMLSGTPYRQYVYGYPHKTAYRAFTQAKPLSAVWSAERADSRFLYVHVPFCEMRCGFCNLFTTVNPVESVVERFLSQLEREAEVTAAALSPSRYSRAAIGGGTPTYLDPRQLERVLTVMRDTMGLGAVPLSVELSPSTVTREKLEVLAGATRLSLGVQSFVEAEVAAVKRPQSNAAVVAALDLVREASTAYLNVDLIYGMEGQTASSFVTSLELAMRWRPEEVYLYPLYVRPLTFLGKRPASWDDHRLELYRTGRDWLISHGYRQRSMRVFQREHAGELQLPEYHAEDDGMVGLGVGARSYTKAVHYAHDWAVGPRQVRGIIDAYLDRPVDSFRFAHSGFELSAQEQQRRWVVLTLFGEGLDEAAFARRFGVPVTTALPMLEALSARGLAVRAGGRVTLTASGLERSDALGPWLFSSAVETLMSEWEAR